MPVTTIVGAQFGSEGKGKVALLLAQHQDASIVVRVGGSNSGHTAYDGNGGRHVFRHLPTAALLEDALCVLGPMSYIDPTVLRQEVEDIGLLPDRLVIDPSATVITEQHKDQERRAGLRGRIGSTASGTGAAIVAGISRSEAVRWASDDSYLSSFVRPTRPILRAALDRGERVLIEGTQGYGLSNALSNYYPFVTSRNTTAAAFVAEAGLSPLDVDDVVLVARSFPIRVGGNSGPLPFETDWHTVGESCGRPALLERSSVTNCVRRVARFDPVIVRSAIEANAPTQLVLNHVDYFGSPTDSVGRAMPWESAISSFEVSIGRTFDWVGASPAHLVPRSKPQFCLTTQRTSSRTRGPDIVGQGHRASEECQ